MTTVSDLREIAFCCVNSAAMLRIAGDRSDKAKDELARIRMANRGQAELLLKASRMVIEIADNLEKYGADALNCELQAAKQ